MTPTELEIELGRAYRALRGLYGQIAKDQMPDKTMLAMNAIEALKPCPFCGGDAEMDSQRTFRVLGSGNLGSAVAIYCLQCSADMTLCHADHPGVETDALCADLRDQWNRRHLARPSSAGEKLPADRCDFCDNGIESGWAYCPWCSHVLDYTQASERAPEPSAGEKDGTGDGDIVGRLTDLHGIAEMMRSAGAGHDGGITALCREAAALIEEQRKALEPFANLSEAAEDNLRFMAPDDRVYHEEIGDRVASISYGDLRRARRLVSSPPGKGE